MQSVPTVIYYGLESVRTPIYVDSSHKSTDLGSTQNRNVIYPKSLSTRASSRHPRYKNQYYFRLAPPCLSLRSRNLFVAYLTFRISSR